ncbi:MAG: Type 1 glutamine amidotransferase-like domain-containing protein, partial [Bacteroidales bacterium]|nr:Type 1 glutamine amidotransferase-like domain-containing protein [Bacteroidales bacterium]
MSKLFLSGGGDIKASYSFDNIFFNLLPKNAKILYIPIAMADTMAKTEAALDWFSKLVSSHSSEEKCFDFTLWNAESPLPDLRKFDAVYVGGGNTYKLLMVLEQVKMLQALMEYIGSGGIYYGGSAGAVIAGNSLRTVEEENLHNYSGCSGMDLIDNLSIFPHFIDSEEQKNRIKNICDLYGLKIVAL